jgi:hypothetical protein
LEFDWELVLNLFPAIPDGEEPSFVTILKRPRKLLGMPPPKRHI